MKTTLWIWTSTKHMQHDKRYDVHCKMATSGSHSLQNYLNFQFVAFGYKPNIYNFIECSKFVCGIWFVYFHKLYILKSLISFNLRVAIRLETQTNAYKCKTIECFRGKCFHWLCVKNLISIFGCGLCGLNGTHLSKLQQWTLTRTVVVESYLNDLVCPFSRKTFSTFAICGTCKSPSENADG